MILSYDTNPGRMKFSERTVFGGYLLGAVLMILGGLVA
jgi:hypothetical protein